MTTGMRHDTYDQRCDEPSWLDKVIDFLFPRNGTRKLKLDRSKIEYDGHGFRAVHTEVPKVYLTPWGELEVWKKLNSSLYAVQHKVNDPGTHGFYHFGEPENRTFLGDL